MIVEYDDDGRIFHIMQDPVHPRVIENLDKLTANWLNLEPIKVENDDAEEDLISADVDLLRDYILDGQVAPRPSISVPTEVNVEVGETVGFDVPNPCRIMVDGETHDVTDGRLDLETAMPASYSIVFCQFPYHDHTLTVNVHAPAA